MIEKKAETKLLSLWWFIVLIVITFGIVAGTAFFYSEKIDVRSAEAAIIVNQLSRCLVENGILDEKILSKDFFVKCNLNEDIIDKSSSYFIKISVIDLNNQTIKKISFGNQAFEEDCKIQKAVKDSDNYPRCFEKNMLAIDGENLVKLNILGGSNYEFKAE